MILHSFIILSSSHPYLNGPRSVKAFGGHWEEIGFQGNDPRTDLNRSMKLLSVLQALHWCEAQPELSRRLLTLCGERDRFGTNTFMCIAIGFTKVGHSSEYSRNHYFRCMFEEVFDQDQVSLN